MSENQLATPPAKGVVGIINSPETLRKIEEILPDGLSVAQVQRTALMALHKNPKLSECTPASVLLGIMTAAQFGVLVDGRNAHLIPYKRSFKDDNNRWQSVMEAQFQWDYKGIVQKVLDSPKVRSIHADILCANDDFRVLRGTSPQLMHEVNILRPRGDLVGAYAVLTFRDGTTIFDVMSADEIEAIRKRSKSCDRETGNSSGPWATDYAEMAKKTVIKRLTKLAPMPADIADAIHADSDTDDIPRAQATVIPQASIPPRKEKQTALPPPDENTTTAAEDSPASEAGQPPVEQEQQQDSAPAPKSAAKPAETPAPKRGPRSSMLPTRSKKPEPAAAPAGGDPEHEPHEGDGPELLKLRARLKGDGTSARDFVRVLIAQKWCDFDKLDPENPVIADAGNEDDFASFLEGDNWLAVQVEIKNLPPEDAAA